MLLTVFLYAKSLPPAVMQGNPGSFFIHGILNTGPVFGASFGPETVSRTGWIVQEILF